MPDQLDNKPQPSFSPRSHQSNRRLPDKSLPSAPEMCEEKPGTRRGDVDGRPGTVERHTGTGRPLRNHGWLLSCDFVVPLIY